MRIIMLLRRDPSELTDAENAALDLAFPGQNLSYVRCDPINWVEHAANCQREQPDAVLLPLDRPIPSQAMEDGFPHITIRDGVAVKLKMMIPEFEPFKA